MYEGWKEGQRRESRKTRAIGGA